ncbi:hypothetical protein HDU96_000003 [Phlyctochytrium bullatum]|nr:hypothetical protein HDU96_000003 [Phlyctochytrium bullatum]
MAIAAAVSNVVHCANLATTPQLSNKNDYPTTFRTQSSATRNFKRTTVGILASSDEFGGGMTQLLQTYAPLYNISISLVTTFDISKSNMQEPVKTFADGGIQNIIIIAQYQIVNIMRAAQQLGMLDGSYWMIHALGWTDTTFSSEADQALLKNMTGTWQMQNPLYEDRSLASDGSNADAVDMLAWWNSLFNSNEAAVNPGVSKVFNPSTFVMPVTAQTINMNFTSNCPNDTQLSVASQIPKYPFASVINGTRVMLFGASNMCTGPDRRYLEGNTYLFALGVGYIVPQPTDYMQSSVKCAKALVGMFDYYTKTNQITVEGINNRMLMSLTKGNITQLVNNANLRDQWGNPLVVDSNGDQVMEQDVHVYKYVNISSKKTIVTGVVVGKWSPANDSVRFNTEPFLFLGGKTAPPQPPTIPTLHFSAKKGMRLAFVAITAVCSAFTLALLAYMIIYVKMKIFVASSPLFLALVILGANISYVGIYLFSMYPMVDTPSAFNESKWIAMAIYNWVVIGIVLNAISNFAVKDPDVIFVMEALVVILTQTNVAAVLFVPKVIEIFAGRGNENTTFQATTSSSGHSDKRNSIQPSTLQHTITKIDELQKLLKEKDRHESAALGERDAELAEARKSVADRDEVVKRLMALEARELDMQKDAERLELLLAEARKDISERDELIQKLKDGLST